MNFRVFDCCYYILFYLVSHFGGVDSYLMEIVAHVGEFDSLEEHYHRGIYSVNFLGVKIAGFQPFADYSLQHVKLFSMASWRIRSIRFTSRINNERNTVLS